jgi:hypothetical protein
LNSGPYTHSSGLTWTHHVAQASLKLTILLLPPTECWDYRYSPPCPASLTSQYPPLVCYQDRISEPPS